MDPIDRIRRQYVLEHRREGDVEEHRVVAVDMWTWARWFESVNNRRVAWTGITSEVHVSTIFLGIDHRFFGDGPPIVFETMIFAPEHVQEKVEGGDRFW